LTDKERCDRIDELQEAITNLMAGLEEDGKRPEDTDRSLVT